MLTGAMKKIIENYIINECDEMIVDIMVEKLKVNISREGDDIQFTVTFADHVIANDSINIK